MNRAQASLGIVLEHPKLVSHYKRILAARTIRDRITGCDIWFGQKNEDGYGIVQGRGLSTKVRVHRLAFALETGRLPSNELCHYCHVKDCIRIDGSHVREGDRSTNQRDDIRRFGKAVLIGRGLTAELVDEIRSSPLSSRKAARKYGISDGYIRNLRAFKAWKIEDHSDLRVGRVA